MRLSLLAGTMMVGLLLGFAPRPTVPVYRAVQGAPAKGKAGRFDGVKGWLGLKWKMTLPQVQAVLKRRGFKAKHEWQRGQFAGGCVRTDNLRFDWKGWKVSASLHQTWLSSIWMTRDRQTPAAVRAHRKSLVRRYGTPKRSTPLSRIVRNGVLAWWSNKHTKLTLAVYRYGSRYRIIQTYQRL